MICRVNNWTGLYMTGTTVMKKLINYTSIHTCSPDINPFLAKDSILYSPENIKKTFSGAIKKKHCPEIGQEKNLGKTSTCYFTIP